jgi:hypothetical protein
MYFKLCPSLNGVKSDGQQPQRILRRKKALTRSLPVSQHMPLYSPRSPLVCRWVWEAWAELENFVRGGNGGGRGQGIGGQNDRTKRAQFFWYILLGGSWGQCQGTGNSCPPAPASYAREGGRESRRRLHCQRESREAHI